MFLKFFAPIFVLSTFAAGIATATDCDTNCEAHFSKWTQSPDLIRCKGERSVACSTGITNCDTFRVPVLAEGYHLAVNIASEAHRTQKWPRNADQCHAGVADFFNGAGVLGNGYGAYTFLTTMYEAGIGAAVAAKAAGVWTFAAVEGAKALMHCACKHAHYYRHLDQPSHHTDDVYQISLVNEGWSMWRGPNNQDNRKVLFDRALDGVGGEYQRVMASTFNSNSRTFTEVICEEDQWWSLATGKESSEMAFKQAKDSNWSKCLFRTSDYANGNPVVGDRYFVSLTNGTRWAMRYGAMEKKDQLYREALAAVGGSTTKSKDGFFSTHRSTRTKVICSRDSSAGDVDIGDGAIIVNADFGTKSVRASIETVESEYQGYACIFQVNDADFGPLVSREEDRQSDIPTRASIRIYNTLDFKVEFHLNGGTGLWTSLEGGYNSGFNLVVDRGTVPAVSIKQSDGTTVSYSVGEDGIYEFDQSGGKISLKYR